MARIGRIRSSKPSSMSDEHNDFSRRQRFEMAMGISALALYGDASPALAQLPAAC